MLLSGVHISIDDSPCLQECDMDELCRELSQKVRCDGSMPVMDANEVRFFYEVIIPIRASEANERRRRDLHMHIQQQQAVHMRMVQQAYHY